MNEKKKTLIPRKLKLVPAAMISVIVLAVLSLLGLLNFTPPSLSDSSAQPGEEQATDARAQLSANALVSVDSTAPEVTEINDDSDAGETTSAPEPAELVDVLIDGDAYWVAADTGPDPSAREERTIGEIITACEQCEGDASGIKIRVTRTFEATAQAERALVSALTEAGLTDDQIDQRRTLVDHPQ